jgi:hypothetical protein
MDSKEKEVEVIGLLTHSDGSIIKTWKRSGSVDKNESYRFEICQVRRRTLYDNKSTPDNDMHHGRLSIAF